MKLTTELTRLASEIKKANTRIARLESSGLDFSPAYTNIKGMSLFNTNNIFTTSESGHIKFRTDITKLTKKELQSIKAEVSNFNSLQSSQVKNVKKALSKANETFKKNHPDEKITFNDLRRAYANAKAEEIKKLYGSDTVVNIAKKAQYGDDKFIDSIIAHIDVSTDDYGKPIHTIQQINELIENYPDYETY